LVAMAALVAGCTLSERQYEQYRIVFKQRPDVRAKYLSICIRNFKALSRQDAELMAEIFDTKAANYGQVTCKRFLNAYVSGRLTYQDYKAVMQKKATPRVIRIMRGK